MDVCLTLACVSIQWVDLNLHYLYRPTFWLEKNQLTDSYSCPYNIINIMALLTAAPTFKRHTQGLFKFAK